MQIILANQNPNFLNQTITINILSGQCFFSDSENTIELKELLTKSDFIHPLLNEPFTPVKDYFFHYEYSTLDELFYAAIYVYTVLIHVDNPSACLFKINPSDEFSFGQKNDSISFSIHPDKNATETITIDQLNKLSGLIIKTKFHYSEMILIDDEFTIKELPVSVNGDLLFRRDEEIIELLKQPADLSRFELRYINPVIGFGLYSKTTIRRGEIISLYTGIKATRLPTDLQYTFIPKDDSLNLHMNAKFSGNITRFINHAPSAKKEESHDSKQLLNDNCITHSRSINGIEFILVMAKTDIFPGEQLLYDYGADFFASSNLFRFKKNGRLSQKFVRKIRKLSQHKTIHFRIMANCGVKAAQKYLLMRLFVILITVFVVVFFIGNWNMKPFA